MDQVDLYREQCNTYDAAVLRLLQRHKGRGRPLAIAVILDVDAGMPAYFERGFVFGGSKRLNNVNSRIRSPKPVSGVDGLKSWPSIIFEQQIRATLDGLPLNNMGNSTAAESNHTTMNSVLSSLLVTSPASILGRSLKVSTNITNQ